MTDIIDRLRGLADVFEAQQAPHNLVLHMRAGADEIARLRAGGCARDQGTTQYCAEAARLAAENERLRTALRDARVSVEGWADYASDYIKEKWDLKGDLERIDAALEEGRT